MIECDMFGSPEREASLTADECWAIVWRASNHISDTDCMNPFVAEYFFRMLDTVADMRKASEVVAGALPEDEVPRVKFWQVIDRNMASLDIVTHDEVRASTEKAVSLGIDAVEVALSKAFAEHQDASLPTEFSTEHL